MSVQLFPCILLPQTKKNPPLFGILHILFFQMYRVHKSVSSLLTSSGRGWNDLCVRLPIVKFDSFGNVKERRKREEEEDFGGFGDFG